MSLARQLVERRRRLPVRAVPDDMPPPCEAVLWKFRTNAAAIGRSADVRVAEAATLTIEQLPVSGIGRLPRNFSPQTQAHGVAA
jgi:hypothetical protein